MIQVESKLNVADNSGAKIVSCIKVLGGSLRRYAFIGDLIKVSVKKCLPKSKVKKGDLYNAVVVRTIFRIRRDDFSYLKFNENAVVILNNKFELLGSRVFGPVARELKFNFLKITSLANEVL